MQEKLEKSVVVSNKKSLGTKTQSQTETLKDEKKWSWEFQAKVDLVLAVYFTICTY